MPTAPERSRPGSSARLHRLVALLCAALFAAGPLAVAQNRPDPVFDVAVWEGVPVVAGEVLVRLSAGQPAAQQTERIVAAGGVVRARITADLLRVALPAGESVPAGLLRFAGKPGIAAVQPDMLHQAVAPAAIAQGTAPSDPLWGQQWHLPKVAADVAWQTEPGSPDVLVAVIDSGVHVTHPDLAAHYVFGLDTFAGDDDPSDADGHGTHCTGIAAAVTGNGIGIAGAGNRTRFLAYRCGNTVFPTSALVAAIHDARERGAHVLSLSWGSTWADPAIAAALAAAVAEGCVAVAAAGNNGNSVPFYPAAHPFVIAVGATTATDARASFSNWGDWVDLAAPGQAIYSTWKSGGYKYLSGTSMAAPLVAGGAALLYARLGGVRDASHAAAIRQALTQGAVPVGNWVVHGRLDLAASVALLSPSVGPVVAGLSPSQVPTFLPAPVEITGSGLQGATGVIVNGVTVPLAAPPAADRLLFLPPLPAQLGPVPVAVSFPHGPVQAGTLHHVAPATAQLAVPAQVTAGAAVAWKLGGPPGQTAVLLVSAGGQPMQAKGFTLVSDFVILAGLPLDGLGLAQLSLTVPPATAGLVFHSQVGTLATTLTGTSAILPTAILP